MSTVKNSLWQTITEQTQKAASYLRRLVDNPPRFAVILGSGLSAESDKLGKLTRISYQEIPHFSLPGVPGHPGALAWEPSRRILLFEGRNHLYEGHSPHEVVRPLRVAAELGCPAVILTNSAGALNPAFRSGDLMLITDHINLTGANPLLGIPADAPLSPFVDLAAAYDPELQELAQTVAGTVARKLWDGTYAGLLGPSYETPAELRFLRSIGADAVGMSTVLETIAARHAGMQVLGISLLTNEPLVGPVSHQEVIRVGRAGASDLIDLMDGILRLVEDREK